MSRQRVSVHVTREASGLRRVTVLCRHHGPVSALARRDEHWRTTLPAVVARLRAQGCSHPVDVPAGDPFTPGQPASVLVPPASPPRSGVSSARRAGAGHPSGGTP